MLLFPAGAAPCQGTMATPSCSEGADCCPLSSTCSKGDREDPSVLWEKGNPVTGRCQLPQAPSWGGKGHWKQQGNGGRDLNPEGNYRQELQEEITWSGSHGWGTRAWHGKLQGGIGDPGQGTHRGTGLRLGGHLGCQQGSGCWAPAWVRCSL